MRFRPVKRFIGGELPSVVSWLKDELNSALRELYIGLAGLRFTENFRCYEWEGILSASEERQISHPLGVTPAGYLIFKQVGNGLIDAGATDWTPQVVYLRNHSASNAVTVKVLFFV